LIYSNGFLRIVYSDLWSSEVTCGRPKWSVVFLLQVYTDVRSSCGKNV